MSKQSFVFTVTPNISKGVQIMNGHIVIGNTSFEIKDGYTHVCWEDVVNGDHVYTVGNKMATNGPFEVHDKNNRVLRNIKLNRLFTEYPESLLHKD